MGVAKQVQFPDDESRLAQVVATIPNRDEYGEDDIRILFFSKLDYGQSRSAAKIMSKECQRQGASRTLDDTFSEKSSESQEKLNKWASQGRRGLERWANREQGEKRQRDQFAAIQSVLEAQDEMLARKKEIDHEKLRKVSYKASKVSRHFARMMGKADSYALASELRLSSNGDTMSVATDWTSVSQFSAVETDSKFEELLPRVDELKDSNHERGMFRRLRHFRRQKSHNDAEDPISRMF